MIFELIFKTLLFFVQNNVQLISNFGLSVGYGVHFLPAAAENEPKERRLRMGRFHKSKRSKPHFDLYQHFPSLRNHPFSRQSRQVRGIFKGERMSQGWKMRLSAFFRTRPLFPLNGVSLVRFFPLVERNERRINSPLNPNLSAKNKTRAISRPWIFFIILLLLPQVS